jgi:hypothetical protein
VNKIIFILLAITSYAYAGSINKIEVRTAQAWKNMLSEPIGHDEDHIYPWRMREIDADEAAAAAFNALQDEFKKPHAEWVHYDNATDMFIWKGPLTNKRMAMDGTEFRTNILIPYSL